MSFRVKPRVIGLQRKVRCKDRDIGRRDLNARRA